MPPNSPRRWWLRLSERGSVFNVTSAAFGLAIADATAGANLIVLVLDIRRDRAVREPAAAATPRAFTEASA
jgi:hypothetical protein